MKMSFTIYLFLRYITLVLLLAIFVGCTTTHYYDKEVYRSWNLTYEETLLVQTEPPGVRVYANNSLIGVSPFKTRIVVSLEATQHGEYRASYIYDEIFLTSSNDKRDSPTSWVGFSSYADNHYFVLKAFDENYGSGIVELDINKENNPIIKALNHVSLNKNGVGMPEKIYGERSILIFLEQNGISNFESKKKAEKQEAEEREKRESAESDYSQALANYNAAIKDYETNKNTYDLWVFNLKNAKTTKDRDLAKLFLSITEPLVNSAQRKVQTTLDALNRAQSNLSY